MAVVGRWRGRWLWALGALVGATAAVVYAAAVVHVPAFRNMRPAIAWPVLAALFALSEAVVVHLHFRADTDSISVSELPLVLGLFFATPPHLVLAQVVGAAAGLALVRRQRPSALVMNLATLSLQCMVALLVFHALVRHDPVSVQGWVAAMAATAASAGIGVAATVAAIVVSHHRAPRARTVPTFALGLTATFITANFAVVAALALRDDSLSAVPLLFMTVVLLLAFRAYGKERTRLDS
ncbi:MAG TPA: hypothetical protein VEJ21_02650, partial [Acidimicrobiales bacterium]|nr:hypothetical protein [Acidimicrobiales bacterium]